QADVDNLKVTNHAVATGVPDRGHLPPARDKATIRLVGQPSWTMTKTASPTTYSGPGETITYTYTLNNTGNVAISSIAVSDDVAGAATCPAAPLAPGGATSCSATYQTTQADVDALKVTNHAV